VKRVLLTGGSGFIGAHVLEHLLDQDVEVTVLASFRHRGNPRRLSKLMGTRVDIVTCDLTGDVPDLGSFDTILHLASDSHVDRSITNPVSTVENNVSSVLTMLEYARKYPPVLFLLFSTDEVYGDALAAVDEQQALHPSNPYAASKAAQEMIATAYWRTYQVPVVITNSSNVVGSGQDPEKFIPKTIQALKAGQSVTIHAADGKIGRRFWNPVQNVVTAIDTIIGTGPSFRPSGPLRYHLPGGEEHSNLKVAEMLADILGIELNYSIMEVGDLRPGYDQRYPEFDSEPLMKLGWTPAMTLEECLEGMVADEAQ